MAPRMRQGACGLAWETHVSQTVAVRAGGWLSDQDSNSGSATFCNVTSGKRGPHL